MNWNDYHYIYKDSLGRWNQTRNPVFIASHTNCKAIEKAIAPDIHKYLRKLNTKGN
jgi:hypothetical protein